MKTRKQIAELAALLAMRNPGSPACVAGNTLILCRIGASATTIAEQLCNGVISQEQFETKQAGLITRLKAHSKPYKVRFELRGDPRGYCLRMFNDGGLPIHGNTWCGNEEGYGI